MLGYYATQEILYNFLNLKYRKKEWKEYVCSSLGELQVFYDYNGVHIFREFCGIQMYHSIWC